MSDTRLWNAMNISIVTVESAKKLLADPPDGSFDNARERRRAAKHLRFVAYKFRELASSLFSESLFTSIVKEPLITEASECERLASQAEGVPSDDGKN